jgi:hypothetical protein
MLCFSLLTIGYNSLANCVVVEIVASLNIKS